MILKQNIFNFYIIILILRNIFVTTPFLHMFFLMETIHKMRKLLFIITFIFFPLCLLAQFNRLGENVNYKTTANSIFSSGDYAPFWFTSNQYGLNPVSNNSGYLRALIKRNAETDSLRDWRIGYGADVAIVIPTGMDNHLILQQLYADFQWKVLRLSIGQKERPQELKNQYLSTGGMATGINARPIPQIRLELPDFWTIPRTKDWLAIKAHIAFGAYTDNRWQRKFNAGTRNIYSANSLYHSKELLLRIGNKNKFPFSLTGGIEMEAQFGGEVWNITASGDTENLVNPHQKIGWGFNQFWNALIPGGNDANDMEFSNKAGNHLGSWHLRMDYEKSGWNAGLYLEHFFEDESQMFWQYGWKDMLYGFELNLPRNPILSTLVYEHVGTMDQSGPIYHDAVNILPEQISASDDYYNNHIYGAWQHAGFAMGNPLLISPIYNSNTPGKIEFHNNRIRAHHIGIQGQPICELGYRILYTHTQAYGRYHFPNKYPKRGDYLLLEATYSPRKIQGLSFTAAYGMNRGSLIGNGDGGMITISYSGKIK